LPSHEELYIPLISVALSPLISVPLIYQMLSDSQFEGILARNMSLLNLDFSIHLSKISIKIILEKSFTVKYFSFFLKEISDILSFVSTSGGTYRIV